MALIERIRIAHDPAFDAGGAGTRHAVRVEAELNDGKTWTENVDQRRGSSRYPLTRADIERKFRGLAKVVLSPDSAEKIIERVDRLDELESMEPLIELLRGGKSPQPAVANPDTSVRHSA